MGRGPSVGNFITCKGLRLNAHSQIPDIHIHPKTFNIIANMNLLIVSATPFEIAPLQHQLEHSYVRYGDYQYQYGEINLSILITGVGQVQTAYALGKMLAAKKFDLCINAGVAGAFHRAWELGEVVQVTEQTFADLGVEEADGRFRSVFDLELSHPDQAPFKNGKLINEQASDFNFLPGAKSITVNRVHGSAESIRAVVESRAPDVESMEGGAFFYVCLNEGVPFLEIRALSNYVEPRDRQNWQLELAINNLNEVLGKILKSFQEMGG